MSTSHSNQINEIIQIAQLLEPMSVLDIGVGNGKYGFLLREYLGINRDIDKNNFVIDGIEGYKKYITSIQEKIYNEIFLFQINGSIDLPQKEYDLCLLIDVLEHFDKDKGLELLNSTFSISKFVLLTTPWNIGDTKIQHDNPLENHKYQWTKKDFSQFKYHSFIYNPDSLIVLFSSQMDQIKYVQKKMKHRFYNNIYDYLRFLLRIKK